MSTMADMPWPPKSPHEALMSSPGGRRKFQELQNRKRLNSRAHLTSPSKSRASQLLDDNTDYAVDDEDDEETLQLKLAAIEARLKLKKLQQQNGVRSRPTSFVDDGFRGGSQDTYTASPFTGERKRKTDDTKSHGEVQVPLSPFKKTAISKDPISPRRVVLGIDKGLKGTDVSLRRPPVLREPNRPGSSYSTTRPGTGSSRSGTGPSSLVSQSFPAYEAPKIKSFSDRLRESKAADKAKWEKAQNIARNRSTGFAVDKNELESFKAAAEHSAKQSDATPATGRPHTQEFNRTDIVNAFGRPRSPIRRSKTVSSTVSDSRPSSRDATHLGRRNSVTQTGRTSRATDLRSEEPQNDGKRNPDPAKYEPFSALHLSNRILPHSYVTRKTESMKRLRIPDLLRTVKGPEFELPDTDGDYVVFGIVASKSTPKEHKEKPRAHKEKDPYDTGLNNTSKYMALTLTDLKWSIDLFLFATAFPKYYKMSPGTVIAILNPSIMPPPPHKTHTNAFSLTISSSDDTILEIGTAQDISFCKSIKKDGKVCDAWIDGRKTEFCDFHVDIQLRKTTAQRMEVNSASGFGQGPRAGRFGNRGGGGGGRGGQRGGQENGLKHEGAAYDRTTGSTYYVTPPVPGAGGGAFGHRSAAGLIDADNPFATGGGDFFHRRGDSQGERFRKRLVDQERERSITKRLGELKSVGAEYLRAQQQSDASGRNNRENYNSNNNNNNNNFQRPGTDTTSAREALGLDKQPRNANNIKLGRIKKRNFESSNDNTGNNANNGRSSPVKKTRFITSRGIREAGRDSLGTNTGAYSDDDLDIVG